MLKSLLSLLPLLSISAAELYSTDFENFAEGDNNWVGTDGWLGSESGNDVDSIIGDGAFGGNFGLAAALGAADPDNQRVSIFRPLNHNHITTGESLIEISTVIAIKDSDNSFRDDFYFSIFNSSGARLASIRFDNEDPLASESAYGIWREDGIRQFDTTVDFIHEEPTDLFLKIDLLSNTWSADLDGIPLFVDETFTDNANGSGINLGFVGYEWMLTNPLFHGDNFLFVANLEVLALSDELAAPEVILSRDDSGEPVLTWFSQGDFAYQLQYSDNLMTWKNDLPNSSFPPVGSSGETSYTDTSADRPGRRFYRVLASDPN